MSATARTARAWAGGIRRRWKARITMPYFRTSNRFDRSKSRGRCQATAGFGGAMAVSMNWDCESASASGRLGPDRPTLVMHVQGEFLSAPACGRQVQGAGGVAAISEADSLCRLCTAWIGGSDGETEGQRDGESAGGTDSIPASL